MADLGGCFIHSGSVRMGGMRGVTAGWLQQLGDADVVSQKRVMQEEEEQV